MKTSLIALNYQGLTVAFGTEKRHLDRARDELRRPQENHRSHRA